MTASFQSGSNLIKTMKICPTCRKTYTDDGLNFCLDDGSVLQFAGTDAPDTVMIQQPLPTEPNAMGMNQPSINSTWQQTPQYSMQPQKSSKSWMWIVGVIGVVLLLCGGGIVGFFALALMNADPVVDNNNNSRPRPSPTVYSSGSNSTGETETVDLSKWVRENNTIGTTEFVNGEFIMGAKEKRYYYVLVANVEHSTELANTSVKVRNVNDSPSALGYGLIFLSNPKPLIQGYAFLIDTQKKRYRVVRHEPQKELLVVNWTNSSAIKAGTQENILEAEHKKDQIQLKINGQSVTSIPNVYGYKGGVAGLYSGDGAKIGFRDLAIRR